MRGSSRQPLNSHHGSFSETQKAHPLISQPGLILRGLTASLWLEPRPWQSGASSSEGLPGLTSLYIPPQPTSTGVRDKAQGEAGVPQSGGGPQGRARSLATLLVLRVRRQSRCEAGIGKGWQLAPQRWGGDVILPMSVPGAVICLLTGQPPGEDHTAGRTEGRHGRAGGSRQGRLNWGPRKENLRWQSVEQTLTLHCLVGMGAGHPALPVRRGRTVRVRSPRPECRSEPTAVY